MALLNEHFWETKVDELLNDKMFRVMILRNLKKINRLQFYNKEFISRRFSEALEMFHNDLETMEQGESRVFDIDGRHDVYKINRKIKAIHRKRMNDKNYPQFDFSRKNVDNKFLYILRNFTVGEIEENEL